jgi:hypothetical protein
MYDIVVIFSKECFGPAPGKPGVGQKLEHLCI